MNLKNCLIGLLLMAVSAGAMAEWTDIGSSSAGEVDHYFDVSTIRKSGSTVKMWTLLDLKKARTTLTNGKSYLSAMYRYEYDCNEEKSRRLSEYVYSGNMKNGDIVGEGEYNDGKWSSIPPESVGATEFKIACGAK